MRDPERIDIIIDKLRDKWHQYPDLRLGQLLENVKFVASVETTYYAEDDQWEQWIDNYPGL